MTPPGRTSPTVRSVRKSSWSLKMVNAVALALIALSVLVISLCALVAGGLLQSGHDDSRVDVESWNHVIHMVPREVAPQWSPNGGQIVFTLNDALYTVASDGSRLRRISKNAHWPDVSPDGSRVVYSTTKDHGKGPFYIETSKLDGSDKRRLTENVFSNFYYPRSDASPVWSPDGQRVAFARVLANEGQGIYVINAYEYDLGKVNILPGSSWAGSAWSPDGASLAVLLLERYQDQNDDTPYYRRRYVLYTLGADDSRLTRVFPAAYLQYGPTVAPMLNPAWSPDGRELAFIALEGGRPTALYAIRPDGSGLRTVARIGATGYPADPTDPLTRLYQNITLAWSPDGSHILFTMQDGNVYVANADGSGYRRIGGGSQASWSPDGSRIAVIDTSADSESYQGNYLYTMAPDGSDLRVLVRQEDGDLKAAR